MNIGFDLDGIFIDLPPFLPTWIIERLYRDKDQKKLHYRMPGKIEQEIRKLSHNHFFRPAIDKNIKFLHLLSQKNKYKIFLISSRFGFLEKTTEKILKRYTLDSTFNNVYFNYHNEQPHIFKNNVIKKLRIDFFIDDDLYLLQYLSKENKNKKFFWFNPLDNKQLATNLWAVTSLERIFENI